MAKKITDIKAEQIYDSRKNPTLRVSVFADDIVGTFDVPSGASTGKHEAYELRDGEAGKSGMQTAIKQIENIIKPALMGFDVEQQTLIDKTMIELDGTPQKTKLGGNSMIGVSIASAKVAAQEKGMEIYEYLKSLAEVKPSREEPLLYFNLINGGKHTKSNLAFQEYHIVPQTGIIESIKICREVEKKLDEIILKEFGTVLVKGDEGGIALPVQDINIPLRLLKTAVDELGYSDKVMLSIDSAANSFYDEEKGIYKFMDRGWTTDQMIELYKKMVKEYPMISIEDPLDEKDFDGFAKLQKAIPQVKIVGDDITVTNTERLQMAINKKSVEALIIKPNQIGTLTETIETIKLARNNNIDCIVSHRSGETMDTFISDLAFAFKCLGIKAGALGPKERDVKYERLINIIK